MQKSPDFKYILFPLPMLQEVFKKPKNGIDAIFDVGIYRVAQTIKIDPDNALRQMVYSYYRRPDELPFGLHSKIYQLIEDGTLEFSEDYCGFGNRGEFDPEFEIDSLKKHLETSPQLRSEVEEFYRLRQVKAVLNLSFSIDSIIRSYRSYQAAYNGFKGEPLVSIKTAMMFEYLKDKNDFQRTVFAMYAGIRSIMGNSDFVGTTREMIICRMFGAKNREKLADILKDKKVKAAHNKMTRYQFEKLLDYLLSHKFISAKIGYNKRTYLSCKLTYQELAKRIRERLDKSLISNGISHKDSELQAKLWLNQHLNKSALSFASLFALSSASLIV